MKKNYKGFIFYRTPKSIKRTLVFIITVFIFLYFSMPVMALNNNDKIVVSSVEESPAIEDTVCYTKIVFESGSDIKEILKEKTLNRTLNASNSTLETKNSTSEPQNSTFEDKNRTSGNENPVSETTNNSYSPEFSQNEEFVYNPNIPLDSEIQSFIFTRCKEKGISYSLFLGLIYRESGFNINCGRDGAHLGLCQLSRKYHIKTAISLCGSDNLLDPYVNIEIGTTLFSNYLNLYGDERKALMAYNYGRGKAESLFRQGVVTSNYAERVISAAQMF